VIDLANTIIVSEEVYEMLKKFKRPSESFSDAIKRAIKRCTSITDITGIGIFDENDMAALERIKEEKRLLDLEKKRSMLPSA